MVRDLDIASGGPSRSVPSLAEHQALCAGTNITVLYQDRGNPKVPMNEGNVKYYDVVTGDLLSKKRFFDYINSTIELDKNTIIHLHGLWSPTLHWAASLSRKRGCPYVVSTRGMLAPWSLGHKALKKKIGWWLYQKRDLTSAAALIATSVAEQGNVTSLLPMKKVVVIPNGCDEPPEEIPSTNLLDNDTSTRLALAIGRLHPVKGYTELIDVWASLKPKGWKLVIAGPDEAGYRKTLEDRIINRQLSGEVQLLGEVDDVQKWSLLNRCELFVAPSKTENFGMAIAEALQSGTPVITTTGTPWQELKKYDCGWWVTSEIKALKNALAQATLMDSDSLNVKGSNGRKLISEKYSWEHVAGEMLDLYGSILSGNPADPMS